MKQVLVRSGEIVVEEVPAPTVGPKEILVRVGYSCVSAGTELAGFAPRRCLCTGVLSSSPSTCAARSK